MEYETTDIVKRIIGIDPGLTGAISIITMYADAGHQRQVELKVYDMPTISFKDTKPTLDINEVKNLLILYITPNCDIYIEKQQSMPNQGVSSTFKTGLNFGILIGMLSMFDDATVHIVTAKKWKAKYPSFTGLERKEAKTQARQIATDLFPDESKYFSRVKDDGRADATLIACHQIVVEFEEEEE